MAIKLLQLNIQGGSHFSEVEKFLKENSFDILCFQEVTGAGTLCGNLNSPEDIYEKLEYTLGKTYEGHIEKFTHFTSNPDTSYEANAIFYKKTFSATNKGHLVLSEGINPFPSDETSFEDVPRDAVFVTLSSEEDTFHVLSAHLAWAPTPLEQPHQRKQNLKLLEYMKTLQKPWILTGDFNIQPDQPTILDLEKIGKDLTKAYKVENTLDPINHGAWEKIKPGFPVDYIFVSKDIEVKEFGVLKDVHLSDHLGITATLNI